MPRPSPRPRPHSTVLGHADSDFELLNSPLLTFCQNKAAGYMSARPRTVTNVDMFVVFSDSVLIANSRVPGAMCGLLQSCS